VFCDASTIRLGVSSYLYTQETEKCNLLYDKLKLGLLRQRDIVQLEFRAAKLATDVEKTVVSSWQKLSKLVQVKYWPDS
jgi:Pao retrotransposon peptidase